MKRLILKHYDDNYANLPKKNVIKTFIWIMSDEKQTKWSFEDPINCLNIAVSLLIGNRLLIRLTLSS